MNVVSLDSPIARRELAGVSQLPHLRLVLDGGRVAYEASGTPEELFEQVERLTRPP